MKQSLFTLAGAAALAVVAATAQATTIVDTGQPVGGPTWSFNSGQYFAGEFSVGQATSVASVEAWFASGPAGNVTVQLLDDDGNIPGSVLYQDVVAIGAGTVLSWNGVTGVDWDIAAGTYWVAFVPDAGISGIMPGTAPNPLDEYAQNQGAGWQDNGPDYFDYLDIGVRIEGDVSAVPLPAALPLLLAGLGGLAALRRRA